MTEDQKIIQQFKKCIEQGEKIKTRQLEYKFWKNQVISLSATIFGNNHFQVKELIRISKMEYRMGLESFGYEISKFNECKDFISNIIDQIKNFGLRTVKGEIEKVESGHIFNISQNQSQNQNQSISFEIFLNIIKSELNDKQQKELKEILTEYQKTHNFGKVVKYFKALCDNVLANLIANTILNPSVISQISNHLPN